MKNPFSLTALHDDERALAAREQQLADRINDHATLSREINELTHEVARLRYDVQVRRNACEVWGGRPLAMEIVD